VFSARSLGQDSEVKGFQLIILENLDLSRKSLNFNKTGFYPPIFVVASENREEVFKRVTQELKIDDSNLITILRNLYDEGLLKGVRGIEHDTLDLY
jgi:hypothetical protein